jgi:glycosyltransferase involved in cell wall biosynthesis
MKTSQPLVSVIINCFNGEVFLKNAIGSIYDQTYKNWEIIFWDNFSTDKSASIAQSFDGKLRYFKSDVTQPIYEAKILAIQKAKGEFLTFLDCDDWWNPYKLEKQVPLFDNTSIGFVYGNYWIENELMKTKKIVKQSISSSGEMLNILLKNYNIGLLTLMVRRSSYDQLDYGFDKRFTVIGDFDLVIRLASKWKADFVDEPIAHYRWHGDNFSSNNPTLSVKELEIWYKTILEHEVISKSKELYNIPIIINYSRGMFYMKSGQKIIGFKSLLKVPLLRKEKIKIIIAFILPKFILRFVTRA